MCLFLASIDIPRQDKDIDRTFQWVFSLMIFLTFSLWYLISADSDFCENFFPGVALLRLQPTFIGSYYCSASTKVVALPELRSKTVNNAHVIKSNSLATRFQLFFLMQLLWIIPLFISNFFAESILCSIPTRNSIC